MAKYILTQRLKEEKNNEKMVCSRSVLLLAEKCKIEHSNQTWKKQKNTVCELKFWLREKYIFSMKKL